jgi:hypothetical protein
VALEGMGVREIEIYVDEIYPEDNCNFIVLGALYVECDKKDLLEKDLIDKRCKHSLNDVWNKNRVDCPNKENCRESWHNLNDSEIHYQDVRSSRTSSSSKSLCECWINRFRAQKQGVYCNILFLDMEKIDKKFFGNKKSDANVYNRFFRSLIVYGIKSFFDGKCHIKNIYFDKSTMLENHDYFPKRNVEKMGTILRDAEIKCDEINFIDSDHKKSEHYIESHFIQYVDLLMGTIRQIIFYTSRDELKSSLAMVLKPALDEMRARPHSISNLKISFFPKEGVDYGADVFGNVTRYMGLFYTVEGLEYKIVDPAQKGLGDFF